MLTDIVIILRIFKCKKIKLYVSANNNNLVIKHESKQQLIIPFLLFSYEAENGINVEESGHPSNLPDNPVVSAGSFKYTDPDGTPVSLQYVADENGFQPQGAHLPVAPTPPPIPEYIARALDWIAAHPAPPEKNF